MRYISDAALTRQLLDEWDIAAKSTLSTGDIASYQVAVTKAPTVYYGGYTLYASDAPSSGVTVLQMMKLAEKLQMPNPSEATGGSLEDRLLHWMDKSCPDGTLTHMGETAALLHCSTRQLQRVLRHLTETGVLRRVGKGIYQRNSAK